MKLDDVCISAKQTEVELIDYFHLFIIATGCHQSDAPRRRLVVTGDSARIEDGTTENSFWFFNVLGV